MVQEKTLIRIHLHCPETAHGMPADALIDACDRMGMLVLDENRNFDSTKEGLRQLEMLVKRHRNHPSAQSLGSSS